MLSQAVPDIQYTAKMYLWEHLALFYPCLVTWILGKETLSSVMCPKTLSYVY